MDFKMTCAQVTLFIKLNQKEKPHLISMSMSTTNNVFLSHSKQTTVNPVTECITSQHLIPLKLPWYF